MRSLLAFAALLAGCASRPVWHVRSADGIPRDAPIAIVPATGHDPLAVDAFNGRFVGLVVRDGARVHDGAEWLVSVRVETKRCAPGWMPPTTAEARADVVIRRGVAITDHFEVEALERCRGHGAESSARAVGENLARRVADVVAWRRHAW